MLLLAAALVFTQPQPLAGPAVVKPLRASFVQHEMSGRVVRPALSIEQAAVERLELAADVRERVNRVLTERAAALDKFVVENLLLLNQLQTVQAGGSLLDKFVVGAEAVKKLGEAINGKSLRVEIARVLPEKRAEEFRESLREYIRAVHAEGKAFRPKDPPPRWAVTLGESFASLGRELAASFERQSASGTLFVDYLVAGLNLNEYQRGVIHELKLDLLERTNMRPTEEDQKKLILGAAAYLDKDQRATVIARVTGVMKKSK